jgi:glycosyltransferase involved in cell wall biosynthesis
MSTPHHGSQARANGRAGQNHAVRVFLVGTEFWRSAGGIQYVNRLLARALADISSVTPMRMEGFAYSDTSADASRNSSGNVCWHAFDRHRGAMGWHMARWLLAVQPHLVLFTHANLLPLARLVRRLCPRATVALLAHGVEVWNPLPERAARGLQHVDQVVAPSAYTRERLIAVQGIASERIHVLPHGLDPDWTGGAVSAGRDPRRGNTLLCVARLSRADAYKGVDVLLRAMPHIRSRCPDARCVIAGDGDDRARLEAMAHEMGLASAVEFRGELDADALLHAYQEADLFVLPSRGEGFGIVFAEAMHCGLPVVAARAAATPEVVADGQTGILVPPDIPEALGSAVARLLLLSDERRRMGVAARHRVERLYLYPQFTARWHRWLAHCVPEAVYLARHAAVFARPALDSHVEQVGPARAAESLEIG